MTICIVMVLAFDFANKLTLFDFEKSHQIWRLITAHFTHFNFMHLMTNMLALVLLLYIFPASLKQLFFAFILAMILIDGYLLLWEIQIYAGFSGILYVIPGIAFADNIRLKNSSVSILILLILLLHIFIISPLTLSTEWPPLKGAHLLGFVAGMVSSFYQVFLTKPV